MEVWKDITGFEGKYQVSSLGRIKALARVITCKRARDSVSMAYHKAEKILAGRKYGLGLWLALKLNKPFKGMVFKYADELSS